MRAIKLGLIVSVVGLSLFAVDTRGGSSAAAQVRVVVDPPIFVPRDDFRYEDGYYRTHDGHFYHYDRERNGWHYGRNHEEGVRYEHDHHGR